MNKLVHAVRETSKYPPEVSLVEQTDIAVASQLAQHRHHPAVRAVTALCRLAGKPPLLAVSVVVIASWGLLAGDHRLARRGGYLLASLALASAFKALIKRALSRTRPNVLLDEGLYRVEQHGPDAGPWHSFPSGHTAGGVALARAVARCWPGAWPWAYTGAVAVAAVQVPRGAHYPSDVLAGVVIGVAAEAVVNRLFPPVEAAPDP
jgi:membrane-associated phospholipid phosphatase